jgi:hypothetical protein
MPIDLGCSVLRAGGPDMLRLDRNPLLRTTIETLNQRSAVSGNTLRDLVAAPE